MELTKTDIIDQKLLRWNPFKKERMIISIKTKQGIRMNSPIITGTKTGVSSTKEILCWISKLLDECLDQQLWVKKIEISHTHQVHQLGNKKIRVGEFSQQDIKTMNYLKQIIRYPICLKIVTPYGVCLKKEF